MSGLRLAVTGLEGQIAGALRERAPPGVEVLALGQPQLDLLDRRSVIETLRAVGCDAVVNAAAYTAVDRAEEKPELAMRVNGEGAGYVAEAAVAIGAPLLHISTDYVFDGRLGRPYREYDPINPINVYGRSKRAGEEMVAARCADWTILRTSWVYSPFGTNFVKTMLRPGRMRNQVRVVADQLRRSEFGARHRRCAVRHRRAPSRRPGIGAARYFPHDRFGRDVLGRSRRSGLCRSGVPWAGAGRSRTHPDGRLSHAGATADGLAPGLREIAPHP
jgi:hypothetical protein